MMRVSPRFVRALLTSPAWWLGAAVSLMLHWFVMQIVEEKGKVQFEYHAENAQLAIQNRVRSYIDVLRGTHALFYTTDMVTRKQFQAYISQLDLKRSFPGITSLNFAQRVFPEDLAAFEAGVRTDTSVDPRGYPDFAVRPAPAPPRSEYHVLTYLEPMEANPASFGLDIASNSTVANSLAVARDSGQLTSSGRLIHVEGPNRHIGLAMRMPLYRRGMPLATVADRRAAYYGSVGAGFDVGKLMSGAVDSHLLNIMRVRLYDTGVSDERRLAGTVDPNRLLFDSALERHRETPDGGPVAQESDRFLKRVTMAVGPRVWEAEFSVPKSAILNGFDVYLAWIVLIGGLAGSTLLYGVNYSLTTARRRAVELARDMTKDLRTSETSLAEAQHMAHLGSWTLDPVSGEMTWSAETCRIFGLDAPAEQPQFDDFLSRVHADDRQRVREGLERSIATGAEFSAEHRILQRDGSLRWTQTLSRRARGRRQSLLRGTIMDITERKRTFDALERSQEKLRELTAHQDRIREEERKRIAREIHDELGQTLLALRIDVSMLEARTGRAHPRLNDKVRAALNHLDATVKTIRTIINNLRPPALDLGLTAAIEWQVAEFRRRTGIACDLEMSEKEFAIDDMRATSLFRILQESLANVMRHANASRVVVELYQEDAWLAMRVADNGTGMHLQERRSPNSFGLVGMEERVHALGGEFRIDSAPGTGTVLTIHIPLNADERDDSPTQLCA